MAETPSLIFLRLSTFPPRRRETITPGTEPAYLGGFLLELLDGSLVNASALVDQVAGGGRLAGVDMANDHDVDVELLLCHCCLSF